MFGNRLRLCCDEDTVRERMEKWHPGIERYYVDGLYNDLVLSVPDIGEREFEELEDTFREFSYGTGEEGLAATLFELLYQKNLTIATAESCTGGKVASALVDIAGSSAVFYEGIVAYSNGAKIDRLGVSTETLRVFGAVSAETAVEMANGLLSDRVAIGLSTTGIAGPGGGSEEKPVGLVYIAVTSENYTDTKRCFFEGDREAIREQTKNSALLAAIKHIENNF